MEYELSRKDSSILKGIAILLMVVYHLFRFPERAGGNSYISLLTIKGVNIEYILSDFGQITIGMFVFLSAYGLYRTYEKHEYRFSNSIQRIFKFLLNYWIVFAIFIPIGFFILHVYSFDIKTFILTLFCIESRYNGEWWFAGLYIGLLILFPIVRILMNKSGKIVVFNILFLFMMTFLIKFILKLKPLDPDVEFQINSIINFLYWEVIFCIGYTFARFTIFSKMKKYFIKKNIDKKAIYICFMFMIISIRILGWIIPKIMFHKDVHSTYVDPILVPLFMFCAVNIIQRIQIKKVLSLLGKYSNNIWLTHTFFCYYYFPGIIFIPKVSALIFIWLMMISLAASVVVDFVYKNITKIFDFNFLYKKQINIEK